MKRFTCSLFALLVAALPFAASADDRYDDRYGYDRGYGYSDGYRHGDRYDDRYDRPAIVRCSSRDGRSQFCRVDTRGGVRLVRQESNSPCVRGRTWGYDRRGIWVNHGCRARFEVGNAYAWGGRPGWGGNPGYGGGGGYGYGPQVVRCESHDGRSNFCAVPGRIRSVEIRRQLSRSGCDFNYSWGYRRDGIWVGRGCRAEFIVY